MNILFLFVSLPHLDKTTALFPSLIHEFKRNGHQVVVSSRASNDAQTSYVGEENGIRVLRVKSHPFTGVTNPVKKALAYQEYCLKQRFLVKKHFGKEHFDLIVSHSLPPELAYVVGGLKRHFKCPFYLIQSDYTWQDAVGFGMFSAKSPVALYYRFWEKRAWKLADYIGCPTQGNIAFVRKYDESVSSEKFDFLPFWQSNLHVSPNEALKKEFGLEGKFVVVYGGSVGAAQRIERIVELADLSKEYKDMHFLILGRGGYVDIIRHMIAERGLTNIELKPFMPQEAYLQFLASCDVGMIILNEKTATPNFPSKALSYLSMKVPMLCALDYCTDFGQYLEENQAGLWAHTDDVKDLHEKLMQLYRDKSLRDRIAVNGYALFERELSPQKAYERIMNKVK
jgi:glycosyltransferase involved in cell wall biosynthesis